MTKILRFYIVAITIGFIISSCEKEEDETIVFEEDVNTEVINSFIKENMEIYYYWNNKMPDLNPLNYSNSSDYFYDLLNSPVDKWSFITDDVVALEKYFDGINKGFGYRLGFFKLNEVSSQVIAVVKYSEKGSSAYKAGISRGDIIVSVNGKNLNTDNYRDVVEKESVKLGFGNIVDDKVVVEKEINISVAKSQTDPIHTVKVLDVDGKKVGYLAYTAFINKYNEQLQTVFADFKAQGISELVVDLRYNGGGAVTSAKLLAEMIGPSNLAEQTFVNFSYNDLLTNEFKKDNVDNTLRFIDNANNLNLSRLYVLGTEETASASEILTYSLIPYMDVVLVGEQTHGKYYASQTIKDENGKHKWAIQPLIIKIENKTNSIDYTQGLIPSIEVEDNYKEPFGSKDDVMMQAVINSIKGDFAAIEKLKSSQKKEKRYKEQLFVKENPLKYEMYVN